MNPVIYLLFGFVAIATIGGWILFIAIRRADDGYEDTFGFHPSAAAPFSLRMEASLVAADGLVAAMSKPRRRRSNSRPPMPVASLSPFEQPVPKRRRTRKVDSTPPIAVSTQALINSILGQESAH